MQAVNKLKNLQRGRSTFDGYAGYIKLPGHRIFKLVCVGFSVGNLTLIILFTIYVGLKDLRTVLAKYCIYNSLRFYSF